MEKETIYEIKSLDMKLKDLDKKKKQTIFQIITYAFLLTLGIIETIFAIILKKTHLCVMFSAVSSFCIFLIIIYSIELKETKKQIKAVCKAIADLVNTETKKIFDKIFEDIMKEKKKEPKKAPAKKKNLTKKTTKKTQ